MQILWNKYVGDRVLYWRNSDGFKTHRYKKKADYFFPNHSA